MAVWYFWAKRKQILISFSICALFAGDTMIFTPSASSTSAAPLLLDAARFPCFATGTPPAAITMADVVEILKELDWSPPVPTISSTSISFKRRTQCDLIPAADAVISSIVSPFMARAVR